MPVPHKLSTRIFLLTLIYNLKNTEMKVNKKATMLTKPLSVKNDRSTRERSSGFIIRFSYQRKMAIKITPM